MGFVLVDATTLWPEAPVDDGDTQRFCSTCVFGHVCMPDGYSKDTLRELHCLVEHVGPFHAGDEIFRSGTDFTAVYSVRAGVVKTLVRDDRGREQILGFHTPGELIGLNAVYEERYPCSAVAVDTVMLCQFSFPAIETLSARVPDLQHTLFRMMAKEIGTAQMGKGDFSAEERFAAFLINWSERLAERGYSGRRFSLPMPRGDIANYLNLAAETVSRVIRRLIDEGIIGVDRRDVEVLKPDLLLAYAASLLQRA